ncbi:MULTISPECIES: hypothetical protein [Bacillus]|uniref:hypothetical protein n=1 Tax=Bacillus TaxID=1386 RepID=UPI0003063580|nr:MULTISPECIES: hypothetical protein [Bacillus]
MALVNKSRLTIGLKQESIDYVKEEAAKLGMSASVYIELLIRKDMEDKKRLDK